MTLLVALVAALCWVIGNLAYAQEETSGVRLVDEDVRIPVNNGNYTIAARILRPDGDGPYGAVVLNHGAAVSAEERRTESPELLIHTAAYFARRGYVVVLPLRRGFGAK
jgi:predicted acyl esterase